MGDKESSIVKPLLGVRIANPETLFIQAPVFWPCGALVFHPKAKTLNRLSECRGFHLHGLQLQPTLVSSRELLSARMRFANPKP